MLKDLNVSDVGSKSIKSLVYQREDTIMNELKDKETVPDVKKPVFFQVDFVQGMPHKTPARLAERMETRMEVKKFTDDVRQILAKEDEMLMSEILEDDDAKEKLAKLQEQQRMAERMREECLEAIRVKARDMRTASRPPSRAGALGKGMEGVKEIWDG